MSPAPLTQADVRATYFTWSEACKVLDVSGKELRAMVTFGEIEAPTRVLMNRGQHEPDRFRREAVWRCRDRLRAESEAA